MEITKEQFDRIHQYPDLAAEGKIPGFQSLRMDSLDMSPAAGLMRMLPKLRELTHVPEDNSTSYNPLTNSCIDYSGQGLAYIGLAGKFFDGSAAEWERPDRQIKTFLEEMAEHNPRHADIKVHYQGKDHILKPNDDVQKFWHKVAPDWEQHLKNVPYYLQNETNPLNPRYTQDFFNSDLQQGMSRETSPFLAYMEANPVTREETDRFMQGVQDYEREIQEQEMLLAMQQSHGRSITR